MSSKAIYWALEQRGITPTEFRVLMFLADTHNKDTGFSFWGKARISEECEISESTVKTVLRSLVQKRLIRVERQREGDRNLPNRYWLELHQGNLFSGSDSAPGKNRPRSKDDQTLGQNLTEGGSNSAPESKSFNLTTQPLVHSATAVAGSAQVGYRTRKGKLLAGKALAQFEYFWNEFHRGWEKRGKAEAGDAWYALTQGEELPPRPWAAIIAGAKAEAQARAGLIARGLTPKMAEGWLLGRRWEDYEPQADPDPRKPLVKPPEPPWYEDISGILAKAGEFGMAIGRDTDCLEAAEFVIRQLEERDADPPPELVQWRDLMQDAKTEEAA